MVFGLALVLALVFGVATTALGANGQSFILGKLNNAATAVTGLVGNVDGGASLRVTNPNTGTNDTALDLRVQAGEAPMRVNSDAKVANLNADKLDGLDSTDVGRQRWAVINADGTIARSNGADATWTGRYGPGYYLVSFNTSVNNCAYVATTTGGLAGQTGVLQPLDSPTDVQVFTVTSDGTRADMPFHLVVAC